MTFGKSSGVAMRSGAWGGPGKQSKPKGNRGKGLPKELRRPSNAARQPDPETLLEAVIEIKNAHVRAFTRECFLKFLFVCLTRVLMIRLFVSLDFRGSRLCRRTDET